MTSVTPQDRPERNELAAIIDWSVPSGEVPGWRFAHAVKAADAALDAGYSKAPVADEATKLRAVREQISAYFAAIYGKDYVYRPPEAFAAFEQWMYSIATGNTDFGAKVMDRVIRALSQDPGAKENNGG